MKAQHTPGPWVVDGKEVFSTVGGRRRIAQVWNFDVGQATSDANARLISAAPEILQALQELLEDADNYADDGVYPSPLTRSKARAAIAKATGVEV